MQSGNIKKFLIKIDRTLQTEVSVVKMWQFCLRKLTSLNPSVKEYELDNYEADFIGEKDALAVPVSFKSVNTKHAPILIKDTELKPNVGLKSPDISIPPMVVRFADLFWPLKVRSASMGLIGVVREYFLRLFAETKGYGNNELSFNVEAKFIPDDAISVERYLKTTEEIIEILPYDKQLNVNKLFRLPISKRPVAKSYFTEEKMDSFREALAGQNKTTKYNVKISAVYDRFYPELYSNLRIAGDGTTLLCYQKKEAVNSTPQSVYYLVVGSRKDNNVSLRALVKEEILVV